MEWGPFFHETRILQHLRARGFRPKTVYGIGVLSGIWPEAIQSIFPAASYHFFEPPASDAGACRQDPDTLLSGLPNIHLHEVALGGGQGITLDEYVSAREIPAPQVVKIGALDAGEAILKGSERALQSVQVLIVEACLDRHSGPKKPLLGEMIRAAWPAWILAGRIGRTVFRRQALSAFGGRVFFRGIDHEQHDARTRSERPGPCAQDRNADGPRLACERGCASQCRCGDLAYRSQRESRHRGSAAAMVRRSGPECSLDSLG